eukprot:scaffold13450_cov99-Amphora_coffeaeformis.AAC.2
MSDFEEMSGDAGEHQYETGGQPRRHRQPRACCGDGCVDAPDISGGQFDVPRYGDAWGRGDA